MAPGQSLDMKRICRVCLQGNIDLFLLFDENHALDGVSIFQILTECTIYKVERHDDLPHQICRSCMETAKSAYRFKKRTEHSYRQLVGLLDEVYPGQLVNGMKSEQATQTDKLSIYPCEMCDAKFFETQDLRAHRLHTHKGNGYKCKVCWQKFARLQRLKEHLALQHPEKGFTHDSKCTVCGKQFSRKDHMRRHMKNIHGKGFRSVERSNIGPLVEPEISTTHEVDSKWVQLQDEFVNDSVRNAAIWRHYSANETDSDDVGDVFDATLSISRENHVADEKPLLPTLPGVALEPQLKTEPLDVDFANKYFETPAIMSSELILKCEVDFEDVDKEYMSNNEGMAEDTEKTPGQNASIVRKHLENKTTIRRRRVPSKDVKCPVCDRAFTRRSHVQRHMFTHTLEKPYGCPHCSKRFTRSDHLKSHIYCMHTSRQYKCDQCDFTFPRSDALARHKTSRHSDGSISKKVCHNASSHSNGRTTNKVCYKAPISDFCEKYFSIKTYLDKHRLQETIH